MQHLPNLQVMLPFYTSIPQESMVGLECVVEFDCPKGEEWDGEMRATSLRAAVHRATIDGISVLLIAPADRNACNIFKGDRIYGGSYNELEAYLFFCRCAPPPPSPVPIQYILDVLVGFMSSRCRA